MKKKKSTSYWLCVEVTYHSSGYLLVQVSKTLDLNIVNHVTFLLMKIEFLDLMVANGAERTRTAQEIFNPNHMCDGSVYTVPRAPMDNLQRVRDWLKACSLHKNCSKQFKQTLPYRILDVGSSENPRLRLVEDCKDDAEYIALSYCWGVEDTFVTTRDNLAEFKLSIDARNLPQTFVDAIKVSRHLGQRYLWIDALCILQKDPVDWEEQSQKMGDIYSRAWLMISAANSRSVHEGFLRPRPPNAKLYGTIQEGEVLHKVYISVERSSEGLEDGILSKEPLTTRGWTLQERLLSQRKLHFCKRQIYWQCGTEVCSEDYCDFLQQPAPPSIIEGIITSVFVRKPRSPSEAWKEVVQVYSGCQLSEIADRLPAISGLAHQFSRHSQSLGQYYAGHWENDLLSSLLWFYAYPPRPAPPNGERCLPSWSWTAYHGENPLAFLGYNQQFALEIKSVDTELWGTDQFGRVKSGRLGLSGSLIRVSFTDTRAIDVWTINSLSVHTDTCQCDFVAKVHPDDEVGEKTGADLYMIIFAFTAIGAAGLLLSANQDGTYRRVGMVDSLAKESQGSHCKLPRPEPSEVVIV
jgi:hypothetical protein